MKALRPRIALLLTSLALLGPAAHSQVLSGGSYVVKRQLHAAGGGRSSGGSFVLVSSIGQANAGPSAGGTLALTSGFHGRAPAPADQMFKNGFEN